MTDNYIKIAQKHRTKVGLGGFIVAVAIAAAYVFVLPSEASNVEGVRRLILTYGHSMVWILLAITSLMWGYGKSAKSVRVFLYTTAAIYIGFVVTLVTS